MYRWEYSHIDLISSGNIGISSRTMSTHSYNKWYSSPSTLHFAHSRSFLGTLPHLPFSIARLCEPSLNFTIHCAILPGTIERLRGTGRGLSSHKSNVCNDHHGRSWIIYFPLMTVRIHDISFDCLCISLLI